MIWLPGTGWVEWDRGRGGSSGRWAPMTQETQAAVASWAEFIVEALPDATPLCARCSRVMDEHMLFETFGERDGVLVCP